MPAPRPLHASLILPLSRPLQVTGDGAGKQQPEDRLAAARQKNREAQQRFRERQRAAAREAEVQYNQVRDVPRCNALHCWCSWRGTKTPWWADPMTLLPWRCLGCMGGSWFAYMCGALLAASRHAGLPAFLLPHL